MFRRSSGSRNEPKGRGKEEEDLCCSRCGETELVKTQHFEFTGCKHIVCGLCFAKSISEKSRSTGIHCTACNSDQKSFMFVEVKRSISHHEKSESLTIQASSPQRSQAPPQPPRSDSRRNQRSVSRSSNRERTPSRSRNRGEREASDGKQSSPHQGPPPNPPRSDSRRNQRSASRSSNRERTPSRSSNRGREAPEGQQRTRSQSRPREGQNEKKQPQRSKVPPKGAQLEPPGAKSRVRSSSRVRSLTGKKSPNGQSSLSPMDVLKREQKRFGSFTE